MNRKKRINRVIAQLDALDDSLTCVLQEAETLKADYIGLREEIEALLDEMEEEENGQQGY